MEKTYKYRIYPNKKQAELIDKTFGCVRFVYNYYLNKKIQAYEAFKTNVSLNECIKDLTYLKNECKWLKEVDKFALQNAIRDLDFAYKMFFKVKGFGFPHFKTYKSNKKSYRTSFSNNNIAVFDRFIKLPKIGLVKKRNGQKICGRILNATIKRYPSGKYYIMVCCTDVEIKKFAHTGKSVGIDVGIKSLCVTSDGYVYENNKFLKSSLKKLVMARKAIDRKSLGSKNRDKARMRYAKIYEKIVNQKIDYINKMTTEMVCNYDVICVESLTINNMVKNHKLAMSINDASWGKILRELEYKAKWHDKSFVKIPAFFPSSRMCSRCGYLSDETKNLSVRRWTCPNCLAEHDRDFNASSNILDEGLKIIQENIQWRQGVS